MRANKMRNAKGNETGKCQQRARQAENGLAVAQRPVEDGIVDPEQGFHQPVLVFGLEGAAHEDRAEHRHGGDGQQHCADQGEGLRVGERMEKFALLARE